MAFIMPLAVKKERKESREAIDLSPERKSVWGTSVSPKELQEVFKENVYHKKSSGTGAMCTLSSIKPCIIIIIC